MLSPRDADVSVSTSCSLLEEQPDPHTKEQHYIFRPLLCTNIHKYSDMCMHIYSVFYEVKETIPGNKSINQWLAKDQVKQGYVSEARTKVYSRS